MGGPGGRPPVCPTWSPRNNTAMIALSEQLLRLLAAIVAAVNAELKWLF